MSQEVQRSLTEMFSGRRPDSWSWSWLAFFRLRRTFFGGGWWPGGIWLSHWSGLGSSPVRSSSKNSEASENFAREVGGDFGADFVAAAADRGADGGEHDLSDWI